MNMLISEDNKEKKNIILKVLIITFVLNLLVALSKLFYGYASNTLSILADGFHSLMDSSSNIIGFIAIFYAYAPPDEEHHYGHRKAEILASLVIAVLLSLTCLEILKELISRWANPIIPDYSLWSYFIMGVGLLINIFVVQYEQYYAKKINSQLLAADAEHTRSDILVTLSVFVSLIAIQYHWYWLDNLVSLLIVFLIAGIAKSLFIKNLGILLDRAPIDQEQVKLAVAEIPGVYHSHKIRAHGTPDAIYLDLHIWVDPKMQVTQAHQLAHQVKANLLAKIPGLVDATIHIEPIEESEAKNTEAAKTKP